MPRNLGVECTNESSFYFLSYNSDDVKRVSMYAKRFAALSIPIWYDNALEYGENWKEQLNQKIEKCQAVILFFTSNLKSKKDTYVKDEYEYAISKGKKVYVIRLDKISVREDDEQWYKNIAETHCVDAYSCTSIAGTVNNLAKKLNFTPLDEENNRGILEFNGAKYEGDIVDGEPHGKGKYTWENGDTYEGDVVNFRLSGSGKYTWLNDGIYEGYFVDGKRTGEGKYTWTNGELYEGDFVDGNRTGKGKYTWANGDIYEGDFKDGNRTGNGKLTYADGRVHEGEFRDGVFMEKQSL